MVAQRQNTILGETVNEIVESASKAIREGRLEPGDRLPSIRSLASDVGVSPTTVASAYRELKRRSLVEGGQRTRLRVARDSLEATRVSSVEPPPGAIDLASGNPDQRLIPEHREVLRLLSDDGFRVTAYGQPTVEPKFADYIQKHVTHVDTTCLTATSGALDATERALGVWLRPGDSVAVEDPGYPDLLQLIRIMGMRPAPIPVDNDGPTVAGMEAAIRDGVQAVVITPRGQNPTGARLSSERAASLRELIAVRPEILLIEDDHLGPLGSPETTVTTAAGRWAYTYSVAKALGPDLRVAAVAGDEATIARVSRRIQAGPGWVSHLLQRIAAELLEQDKTRKDLARAIAQYDNRRNSLLAQLQGMPVVARGASGLNVWLTTSDEAHASLELASAGFYVAPGGPFRIESPPGVRITTAALDSEQIDGLARAVQSIVAVNRGRSG